MAGLEEEKEKILKMCKIIYEWWAGGCFQCYNSTSCFFKKTNLYRKKKNPQITIHAVQSPCPVGRGPLKE